MRRIFLILGMVIVIVAGAFTFLGEKKDITLFFTDLEILQQSDCSAVLPTTRSFRVSRISPDAVLRELLRGPNPEEREWGMASMYLGLPGRDDILPLLDYYQGISVKDGIATVDFAPEALAYLNAAACIQAAVKAPIEWTLLEFPEIMRVEYSIDGKVFDQWDA